MTNHSNDDPERINRALLRVRAIALEAALARAVQGQLTPGSGSKGQKGDAQRVACPLTGHFGLRCEAKFCGDHDGISCVHHVQLDWLETIWTHAQRSGQIPVLALEWRDGTRVALIPYDHVFSCEGWFDGKISDVRDQAPLQCPHRTLHLRTLELACPLRLRFLQAREQCQREWCVLDWEQFTRWAMTVPGEPPLNHPTIIHPSPLGAPRSPHSTRLGGGKLRGSRWSQGKPGKSTASHKFRGGR